ncbi:MAG TPA: hypothetical protein VFK92_15330 [Burkholderiales bacterium]|nr:hypothetical protein [Burkholderiales bacterium]
MDQYRMLGFLVILILYATVGLLAAAGAVSVTRKIFGPRAEQVFYGLFLVLVAAFYLGFVAYFGNAAAWRVETAAVIVFAAIGLFGARLPVALVIGYPLHGLWDLLHELQAQGAFSALDPGQLSAVPLAYGVFCAAFDVCIAGYAYARRSEWSDAWRPQPQEAATPQA